MGGIGRRPDLFQFGLLRLDRGGQPPEASEGHARFVAAYTVLLAGALGLRDRRTLGGLERGALLHDIGKIGVPAAILNKPGPLTTIEKEIIREHPVHGYRMIEGLGFLKRPRRSSSATTSGSTARAIPRGLAGMKSLSRPGSSPWPTPWTRSLRTVPTAGEGVSRRPSGRSNGRKGASSIPDRRRLPVLPRRTWEQARAETRGSLRPGAHPIGRIPATRRSVPSFFGLALLVLQVGLGVDEDLAGLASLGRTDDPLVLHLVDDPGRPGVAELQAPLEVGRGGLAGEEDELEGLVVEFVLLPELLPELVDVALDGLDDALVVFGSSLLLDELDEPL